MTEIIFILTTVFISYCIFALFNSNGKKSSEYQKKQQEQQKEEQKEEQKKEQKEEQKQQDKSDNRSDEEILGLPGKWTQEQLKTAYRHKCNQLHPDKWEKMPEQMQILMNKEFKAVQQSYKNLLK